MKISICIAYYKSKDCIKNLLDSIYNQEDFDKGNELEVVLVNDGSPDWSESFENELVNNYRKYRLTIKNHETNKGLVETRKTGAYSADGDYIIFCDADDTLPLDAIKTYFEFYKLEPNVHIYHGLTKVIGEDNMDKNDMQRYFRNSVRYGFREFSDKFDLLVDLDKHLWNKMIKTEVLISALTSIPETYCVLNEEVLIQTLLNFYAKNIYGIERYVYNYHYNVGISSSNKESVSLQEFNQLASSGNGFRRAIEFVQSHYFDERKDKYNKYLIDLLKIKFIVVLNSFSTKIDEKDRNEAYKYMVTYYSEEFVKESIGKILNGVKK